MKVFNLINNAKWTLDCGVKQNLDFPILECSTRYYSDYTAVPSFICYDHEIHDYIDILALNVENCIKGNSKKKQNIRSKNGIKITCLKL